MKKRPDLYEREIEIIEWISQNKSKTWISKQLNCKRDTLEKVLKSMNICYKGTQGKREHKIRSMSAIEYLETSSVRGNVIKEKLIADGIKERKCEECKNTEWMGNPIPLELHHKDGDHYNNNLKNLALLCPNCHAQETAKARVAEQADALDSKSSGKP